MSIFDPPHVEWTRVQFRLAWARRLSLALRTLVWLALLAIPWFLLPDFRTWILLAALPIIALSTVRFFVIGRAVRNLGYAERDDDLWVTSGALFRRLSVVPYGRMQLVDVEQGPLDRLFGLATVQLHTASAGTDAVIPGLTPAHAETLRDRLTELGTAEMSGL